jgi:hypothetical protein
MSLHLYKPTAKNTGLAIGLQASDQDKHLYVNLIKQASWNAETKRGSFTENKDKPGASATLKFNQLEAASLIDAIETNGPFKAYHDAPKRTTQITFEPSEAEKACWVFKVSQTSKEDANQKTSFFMPITYGEARLIKEYLLHYLHKSFAMRLPSRQRAAQPEQAAENTEPQTPAPEEAQEPSNSEAAPAQW